MSEHSLSESQIRTLALGRQGEIMSSDQVTVEFVGFGQSVSMGVLKQIVLEELGFVEASNPQIVVCAEDLMSMRKVLEQYPNKTLRILFNKELGSIDFNVFDYVIGWEELHQSARYARMHPVLRLEGSPFRSTGHLVSGTRPMSSRKFCSFVATNGLAHPMRDDFVRKLSRAKRVESWGQHMNNSGPISNSSSGLGWQLEKMELESGYKFSLAIENGLYPGYTTEKVLSGAMAGAIPIYWGNPQVGDDINLERIFSLHEFDSADEAISAILALEGDLKRLEDIVRRPIMTTSQEYKVAQSRQAIVDLFLHAAETSRCSALLRPTGTTAYTREVILVSALRREERVLRQKASAAKILRSLGLLGLALKVMSEFRAWRKEVVTKKG